MTRQFDNGSNRNGTNGKLHPYGFTNPLCDHSFFKYMDSHRLLEDGTLRDPDNWQKGWDRAISLDSLARHVEDLKNIHRGYFVYKEKIKGGEVTHVLTKPIKYTPWHLITEEECCNAIRFNAEAYKLEVIKNV